jgi:hypothetical protein
MEPCAMDEALFRTAARGLRVETHLHGLANLGWRESVGTGGLIDAGQHEALAEPKIQGAF